MPAIIRIDRGAVTARINRAWANTKGQLAEEILADCNEYCKMDTGLLIASSMMQGVDQMSTELTWNTPYAKRQYWGIPTAYTDKNPKATWQWCKAAQAANMQKWERQAEILMKQNL